MNNSDRPAMPYAKGEHDCDMRLPDTRGLTKREYFAAMAMQGWLSCQHEGFSSSSPEDLAVRAVDYADALLKRLES